MRNLTALVVVAAVLAISALATSLIANAGRPIDLRHLDITRNGVGLALASAILAVVVVYIAAKARGRL
jgi:hypothetical protein